MVGTEGVAGPAVVSPRSVCVDGRGGGDLVLWGMGSTCGWTSTLPLCTKTLAWGLATITRGGGTVTRPDEVVNSAAGLGAGSLVDGGRGTACDGDFWGKRGVVFAVAGEPVRGGAEGLGGVGGVFVVAFEILGMGLVTAVDHAGGALDVGAGSSWDELCIGSVVAAETLGRGVGVILAEAGLSGRGGRLMRRVSRLGAFGSDPSGVAESAIMVLFIVIPEKVQWRNRNHCFCPLNPYRGPLAIGQRLCIVEWSLRKAESAAMTLPAQASAKILIIEDNEVDALLLQETLKEAGARDVEVAVAEKLSDAFRLLDEKRFDVVLSDLSLPDSQGLETFTRLYAHAAETPIILLTGFEDSSLGLEAVRAGAQEYVVKGTMNGKALWRVISYAIERQSLRKVIYESERRYRRLLDSVTDYIYTVKVEHGRAVATSHGPGCARVTGYPPDKLDKDPQLWFRMVHEDDRSAVLKQVAHVLAGDPATLEHRIIHKDGSIRWVRHTPVLRRDEHERLVGYDGLISDITERKLAEEALRRAVEDLQQSREALKTVNLQLIQAEKMETVGRMAAGVAHEVQNPLQILLMSLDYLSQRTSAEHDAVLDGVIGEMRQAAKRADTTIRGLLDFSHSDTLELKLQDINALIKNALALTRHNFAASHITLETSLGADLPSLALDGVKIEQVFVNLLTNAIDAMPHGGTLMVGTRTKRLAETYRDAGSREGGHFYAGDRIVVADVEDTGSGIPPEALRKIFDPFFTTKPTGKGTGLGLAVVKRIMDLHSGNIEITNRAGGGAHCQLMFKARS